MNLLKPCFLCASASLWLSPRLYSAILGNAKLKGARRPLESYPIFRSDNILVPDSVRKGVAKSDVERTRPSYIQTRTDFDIYDIHAVCAHRRPVGGGLKSAQDSPADKFNHRDCAESWLVDDLIASAKAVGHNITRKMLGGR